MNITFCIPTYNRLNLLERCINSILQLTFDYKVIIADNYSLDGTKSYCESLVQKYDFISYYRHSQNIGSINNFLFVIGKVSTDYISIIADDDYFISENYIEFYKEVQKIDSNLYVARAIRLDSNNFIKKNLPENGYNNGFYVEESAQNIILSDLFMWSACIFKSNLLFEIIDEINLKDENCRLRNVIDVSILYCMIRKYGFYFINIFVQIFQDHPSQSSKPINDSDFQKMYEARVAAFDLLDTSKVKIYRDIYLVELLLKSKVKNHSNSFIFFYSKINYRNLNFKMKLKFICIQLFSSTILQLFFKRN
jgi:glycosyltransferase involved in cell wall biosynthesis